MLLPLLLLLATTTDPVPPKVDVQLLADASSIAPNSTTWLGVRFKLEPGWHIYWVNPGDSGQPPRIEWHLPPGFTAGEIAWPYPEKLESPSLRDYGYKDEVLLLVPLQAPANASGTVNACATVKYIVCREVCVPGKADVKLTVPVAAAVKPSASSSLFTETRKKTPQALPKGWTASATSDGKSFLLNISGTAPIRSGWFFPLDAEQIENAAPQKITPTAKGAQFTLQKSEHLLKPIARLRGVIYLATDRAYNVDAAVRERTPRH